jgi:hypothetical protein
LGNFKVFTVDSYQGEENEIILLSLVRSNSHLGIGFLDNKNRLVVALSRARRGLYIFGNSITLSTAETNEDVVGRDPLWFPLLKFMSEQGRFQLDGGLPLTCSRHRKVTRIFEDTDFDKVLAGGCDEKCEGGVLPCGHPCTDTCHPWEHTRAQCRAACPRMLTCGHKCSKLCREVCYCDACCLYNGQVSLESESTEDVNFFGDSGPLGSAFGESAPKGILKRSESHQLSRRHVTFAQATKSQSTTSNARPSPRHGNPSPKSRGSRPSMLQDRSLGPATHAQPARQASGQAMIGSSGSRVSPTKPRSKSLQSHADGFGSRAPIDERPGFGATNIQSLTSPGVQAWNNWDAKQADEELAERRRLEEEAMPKVDRSTLVFKETYRPTALNKDGERVAASSSRRRVVARSEVAFDSSMALHSFASGSPAAKSGDGGYSKNGKTLLGGFKPHSNSNTEVSQRAKSSSTAAGYTSAITSGMSGMSMYDKQLPAFGIDVERPMNDERSGQASRPKSAKPRDSRGGGLSRPRGAGSSKSRRQQSLPTGDLMTWEDPLTSSTSPVITKEPHYATSAIDMNDLYGASPPRFRSQENTSLPTTPSATPRQEEPTTPIARGATSKNPEKSTGHLVDAD